ncbi:MAG TPA: PD-(D/E)XK nuclease family protein [Bryobacteraceae bacterium]|nr:PD-(D/E)XK nuclease family protein [Bryobacteraceae bacterium]
MSSEARGATRSGQAQSGAAGLHRTSLVQLAASLARPAMALQGLTPLGRLGLEAMSARIAHQALQANELKYFAPVAALPGFARALAKTLAELRLARIDPTTLGDAGPAGADLERLLARYRDELAARSLADLAEVLNLALQAAELGGHPLLGLPLLRLDAPLETRSHRAFFEAVARRAAEVLELELGQDTEPETPPSKDESSSVLEHLRRYVFALAPAAAPNRSGFEIFSAPGEGLEAVEIARRILRLASDGVRFDQIAIVLRDPQRYQPMVEDALRRASIPAWFSHGTMRPDPAGRAFLALLACAAEKCSASRFAEYLSFGQVPSFEPVNWVAPQDELLASLSAGPRTPGSEPPPQEGRAAGDSFIPAPAAWERLIVDAAVIGGRSRWERRLKGLEREFELRLQSATEASEAQRSYLAGQLDRLRSLSAFALPLITRLDTLRRTAYWSEWLKCLRELAQASLRDSTGVLAVLAELEPMGEVGPVSVEEVAEVLSERLRFLRSEPPGRRWGRVFVGSIDEVRGCEFSVVFLPGLAEGLFPQRALEDPLLLDAARSAIGGLPSRHDRNLEERERLLVALAAARNRFIASYPRMDVAEARPRVPSFYALELPRALEGSLPKLKPFEEKAREAAPARLNWPAPPSAADAIDDAEYDLAVLGERKPGAGRHLVETNPHLARSLRARWRRWQPAWTPADGLIAREPAALEALAMHSLSARAWSPSSLEQFALCPYRFALHAIYRLHPRCDAAPLQQLDPLTRGALFHEVQASLLMELKQAGLLPLGRGRRPEQLGEALAACDRTLNRIAAEYYESLAPAIERVWKTEIEDLRTDLRGWLHHAAQNDGDWEPLHFEFSFGLEPRQGRDPSSTAQEAALEGVRLKGSIDLIERHADSGVFRVTDHKTGKPPERVPLYVGGGRTLQPLLYGLAVQKIFGAKVEGGRLFYATQRGGYRSIRIELNERSRAFLARALRNIEGAICSGFLPPAPEKDACRYCDYRLACGPYEERRFRRYKDRREQRLEPLFELRGMA